MAASVNGWRVIGRGECVDVQVPGGVLPVHPEFAWLAWDCANLWHETVEPLVWPGCWGWADRPIRGGTATSNHASGTAWDLCAPKHPQGKAIAATFTPAQLEAVSRLEARYFGVLDWGGRWAGKSVDGMHWEGRPGVSVEAVRDLTAILRTGNPVPAPAPPAPVPSLPKPAPVNGVPRLLERGPDNYPPHDGRHVLTRALQTRLRTRFPLYAKRLVTDGWYGAATETAVREFQRRSPGLVSDGVAGPATLGRLGL